MKKNFGSNFKWKTKKTGFLLGCTMSDEEYYEEESA